MPNVKDKDMNQLFSNTFVIVLAASVVAGCTKQEASPDPTAATASQANISVQGWGPQATTTGTSANVLPSGESGLYVTFTGNIAGDGTQVLFDGKSLGGVAVSGATVTAVVPNELIATAGDKSVVVVLPSSRKIQVGNFVVSAPSAAADVQESASEEKLPPDTAAPVDQQ